MTPSGRLAITIGALLTGALPGPAAAASVAGFTVLGSNAGPIPDPRRGEPANVLATRDGPILIDVGDGATDRLGRKGISPLDVRTVFISHLHFDHTGGLFAFLGQRFQMMAAQPVTIYGPAGTRRTVDALIEAMEPITEKGTNIGARSPLLPQDAVRVIELADGQTIDLGSTKVTVVRNTHYDNGGGGWENARTASLSFRFDMPGRSVVYTGDTGPSSAVESLAKGADVLVTEIMDPDEAVARLRASRPELPEAALKMVEQHHRQQHLSPVEVGLMAKRAGVHEVVLTHIAIDDSGLKKALAAIRRNFSGPVSFARDGETF